MTCNRIVDSDSDGLSKRSVLSKKDKKDKKTAFVPPVLLPDPYPEICIPSGFQTQFEMDHDLSPGQLAYLDRELKDKLNIRYMQDQILKLKDFHKREIREMEIRIRNKMHGYARACLHTIMYELLSEYKLIFTQFDLFKNGVIETNNKIA